MYLQMETDIHINSYKEYQSHYTGIIYGLLEPELRQPMTKELEIDR